MSRLEVLLRAVRAPSLTAGAMPAIVLAALASYSGERVDGAHFALTLMGLVLLQSGVNLVNDLFDDASGLDADPDFADSAFPLGSRVIQDGVVSRRAMQRLAIGCFAGGAACGLVLNAVHPGNTVLWLGLVGAALGYAYTAPPLRIAYHGAGEPITFALFGPVAGMGSYYVYTGDVSGTSALLSCVLGVLSMAILFLHHFPQHDADARHGKLTPIVRLGRVRAGRWVPHMLVTPYLLVAVGWVSAELPTLALAFFATTPLAWRAGQAALEQAESERAMAAAALQVLGVHFLGSLLLAGGLWLA